MFINHSHWNILPEQSTPTPLQVFKFQQFLECVSFSSPKTNFETDCRRTWNEMQSQNASCNVLQCLEAGQQKIVLMACCLGATNSAEPYHLQPPDSTKLGRRVDGRRLILAIPTPFGPLCRHHLSFSLRTYAACCVVCS